MDIKLPSSVASLQDLMTLAQEVKEYSRWYAHESVKKQVDSSAPSEPPIVSPATLEIIHIYQKDGKLDQRTVAELIEKLEDYGESAPALTITLAAPPTNDIKTNLVSWCRENIAPNVLVSFRFNATILGGIVVRSGSHIFDWSFRRKLLDARSRFPEVLSRV